MFIVVTITRPPEDTTACRGSEVIISCGHNSTAHEYNTIWSINGSEFHSLTLNNPLYLPSNQTLIIFSIDYTATFQCAVQILQSTPIVLLSTNGTVTVVGTYVQMYLVHTKHIHSAVICTYVCMCVYECKHRYADDMSQHIFHFIHMYMHV